MCQGRYTVRQEKAGWLQELLSVITDKGSVIADHVSLCGSGAAEIAQVISSKGKQSSNMFPSLLEHSKF